MLYERRWKPGKMALATFLGRESMDNKTDMGRKIKIVDYDVENR